MSRGLRGIRRSWLVVLIGLQGCGTAIVAPPADPADPPEPSDIVTTLFLIGDAGSPAPREPVLVSLERDVRAAPAEKAIVFLGDNVYPRGLPPAESPDRREAERRLLDQMQVGLRTGTRTWFVPGNHDWNYMGPGGWDAMKRQTAYIAAHGGRLVHLLPRNGCPGPEVVDLGPRFRLIMLDTQWWVHEYDRPADSTAGCGTWTEDQVVDSLRVAVLGAETKDSVQAAGDSAQERRDSTAADSLEAVADTIRDRVVVVLAHHPLATFGEHGGHFSWLDQIFPLRRFASWLWIPLPGIGSAEAVARREGNTNQDLAGPRYQRMLDGFAKAFQDHPPLVFAAGHDHNLQVLRGVRARYVLVSGGGIYQHLSEVGFAPETRYAAEASGYMRLDALEDGKIRLGVIVVDGTGEGKETFGAYLE